MYNLGFGLPLLELWCISLYYFGLIFNFHVIPLVLSTQCDCLDLLITLLTGVCLQHFTIVSEAVSSYYCDVLLSPGKAEWWLVSAALCG